MMIIDLEEKRMLKIFRKLVEYQTIELYEQVTCTLNLHIFS